jgi:hypothetical protein
MFISEVGAENIDHFYLADTGLCSIHWQGPSGICTNPCSSLHALEREVNANMPREMNIQ